MSLRIEDLDAPRCTPAMIDAARRDLEWLGLDWDGEPLLQSTGLPRMHAALDALVARGLAYPCTCTRGDLRAAANAPQQGDAELRYPGTCRGRYGSLAEARAASGRDPALRFIAPEGAIAIDDAFAGRSSHDVQATVGDFPVARRDGSPAYQLAVVIDDAHQGVTEVLRGDDLLASTARQWLLQRALELPHPTWVHVPLVTDGAGRRLAKREKDLGLTELRERGVDPRAIVAWAAKSAGHDAGERVTPRELLTTFALSRVPREPARLDAATIDALEHAR